MAAAFRSFAVVPAAGRSIRMGTEKLLLPWGESTVIETLLHSWQASRIDGIVVVVRPDQRELILRCEAAGASMAIADPPPPEMRDSVQQGLSTIEHTHRPESRDVWLLAPADMPQLSTAVVNQLLAAHMPESPTILAPLADGRRGHPVLFPWPLAAELSTLGADEGVNALLHRHLVKEIPAATTVHQDLDTPEDYERLQGS